MLAACDKNGRTKHHGTRPTGALVKFYNFGVERAGLNFYANDREGDGDQLAQLSAAE